MLQLAVKRTTSRKSELAIRALSIDSLIEAAPFRSLEHLIAKVAGDISPNERLTVTQSAERYTFMGDGGGRTIRWSLRKTPYIAEPQDTLTSLDHRGMIFVGPARTGKSVMFLNWTTHSVMNDPDDMLMVHNDMKNGRKWSKGEFDRYLKSSPEIRSRQLTSAQFDNAFDKQFKSGMRFTLTYPTSSNLSAITVGKVGFMDYDRNGDDAEGEGNPYDMGSVRTRTKGRRGMTAAESSPNPDKEMPDPKWVPESPHDAPPSPGIFELYRRGDRRCWYWPCPHCGEYFEGTFDDLKGWQDIADIQEAVSAVFMLCPSNGCVIDPSEKEEMNLKGIWVPDNGMVTPEGEIVPRPGKEIVRSKIASFWLKGPAAGYFTWGELVEAYMNAEKAYRDTGDEGPLRKTVTTDQGMYYISKARLSDRNPDELRQKAEDWGSSQDSPTVPDWVRFLVGTVDVQKDGFVVQITGFSPNGDVTVVDGFKIKSSVRLNENGENEPVDPRAFAEDWDMLIERVAMKRYALADGSGRTMGIKICTVDGYGLEGVTTNAYRFWQRLKADGRGYHRTFAIIKGETTKTWPTAKTVLTEVGGNNKNALVRGAIPRIHFNPTILKDQVANLMSRRVKAQNDDDGAKLRYPSWMPGWFYSQLTNEVRDPVKGWEKIGNRRNEAFDLTYYALGVTQRPVETPDIPFLNIQVHKINWDKPPSWAAEWNENDLVFAPETATSKQAEVEKPKKSSWTDLAKRIG